MAHVFLFPSRLQQTLLEELVQPDTEQVVIVTPEPTPCQPSSSSGMIFFTPEGFLDRARERNSDKWFCCSELAIYFVSLHRELAGSLPFAPICLDMLTKLEMAEALHAADVPVRPKTRLADLHSSPIYPIIVKPNFGFASTLVKRITSDKDLDTYLSRYKQLRQESLVASYQRDYFYHRDPAILEEILIEPDVSEGTFLSVPFVARPTGLQDAFPVTGCDHLQTNTSSFLWVSFRAPGRLPSQVRSTLDETLDKLARAFARTTAVFEAEIIMDPRDGICWVLEFSPRITGGSIPRLLYHAQGIDLERQALALALEQNYLTPASLSRECLLTRRKEGDEIQRHTPGPVLESSTKQVGDQLFIDEVLELL